MPSMDRACESERERETLWINRENVQMSLFASTQSNNGSSGLLRDEHVYICVIASHRKKKIAFVTFFFSRSRSVYDRLPTTML